MTWTIDRPTDLSQFTATDMLFFLDWWEAQYLNSTSFLLVDSFVEGLAEPYLELVARGELMQPWLQTMLRYRMAAQWVYQLGAPLSESVARGIEGILPLADLEGLPDAYRITPADIAEIPPQIRQGFLEGAKFGLNWVTRLSGDAREQMRGLLAVNQLKNRDPGSVAPILEQVLRRDIVRQQLGRNPSASEIDQWVKQAEFKVLNNLAQRAELIAQTESMRMMNLGILSAMEQDGQTLCYVMPHRGSCPMCRTLIDGKVFQIRSLKNNLFANIGVKQQDAVPALPQHPRCRHSPIEVPFQFRKALKAYGRVPDTGLLLECFGLPGGRAAMESLGLVQVEPWLTREGAIVSPQNIETS